MSGQGGLGGEAGVFPSILTQPSSDLASGLFGRSTDQSLPRAVQLGIRLQF